MNVIKAIETLQEVCRKITIDEAEGSVAWVMPLQTLVPMLSSEGRKIADAATLEIAAVINLATDFVDQGEDALAAETVRTAAPVLMTVARMERMVEIAMMRQQMETL